MERSLYLLGRPVALSLESGDIRESEGRKLRVDPFSDILPESMNRAGPLVRTLFETQQTTGAPACAIEHFGQPIEGDLLGGLGEDDTTLVASLANDEAFPGEGAEDLGEIRAGGTGSGSDILHENWLPPWILETT